MAHLAKQIVDEIFSVTDPVTIMANDGSVPVDVIASPAHGSLMLCQDDNGDYDVIVLSRLQAGELAAMLAEWSAL